ncbi:MULTISPECIES: hypothetical protein [Streptomyces]|uniref:Lipoprotein n=1 Tax=Streptomyces fuscus TaxID=3048495 RepID=A0ABT7J2I8_9ACTN|nr:MULTISPECIES: hypothetical protein [Streptomyces]MCM1975045.1 hypothetical protein [Streptomyces sp. G1]MDL2078611.1 hypothetical protein [Streptomyces fuscus]SBT88111.1 hypothetical protein GA0115233_100156 [Streptomyces sp. DI166]
MTRSRTVHALASALSAAALLTCAACSDGDDSSGTGARDVASASPLAAQTTAPATLTQEGARSALITEKDIEDDWTQVDDAASWRDSLLIGTVDVNDFITGKSDAADCQQLMDRLYSEDLLGKPSGASALRGFEEGDSRLLYQVASYDADALSDSMDWLKSLPEKCDQFEMTGGDSGKRTVQVIEISVPDEGDARQGLRVTVKGTADGSAATLTQEIAAVRVDDNAITVTAGGLDGVEDDSIEEAVENGTPRLEDVLAGKTPQS